MVTDLKKFQKYIGKKIFVRTFDNRNIAMRLVDLKKDYLIFNSRDEANYEVRVALGSVSQLSDTPPAKVKDGEVWEF